MSGTEKIIEGVTEHTEELAERAANLVESSDVASADGLYISKSGMVRVGVLMGIVVAGAGFVGYKVAQKQLQTKYEKLAEEEIAQAKAFYSRLNKEGMETPEKAVNTLMTDATSALLDYSGSNDEEDEEVVVDSEVAVFVQSEADENFDLDEEVKTRTPDAPYVISQEEYLQGEPEFGQTAITYYEGDGTLADENDREIPFIDPIIGEENVQRFGHGSGDENIVFIRNERLSTDFEVLKSSGKFAHEVLGLEHADGGTRGRRQQKQTRKFKDGDE